MKNFYLSLVGYTIGFLGSSFISAALVYEFWIYLAGTELVNQLWP